MTAVCKACHTLMSELVVSMNEVTVEGVVEWGDCGEVLGHVCPTCGHEEMLDNYADQILADMVGARYKTYMCSCSAANGTCSFCFTKMELGEPGEWLQATSCYFPGPLHDSEYEVEVNDTTYLVCGEHEWTCGGQNYPPMPKPGTVFEVSNTLCEMRPTGKCYIQLSPSMYEWNDLLSHFGLEEMQTYRIIGQRLPVA